MKRLMLGLLIAALLIPSLASAGLTITQKKTPVAWGTDLMATAVLLFDNSYPTGGESLTPAQLGLTAIDYAWCVPDSAVGAGYTFHYDEVNEKVLVGGVELTVAVDPAVFSFTDTMAAFSFTDTMAAFSLTDTLTAVTPLPDSTGLTIYVGAQTTTNYVAAQTTTNYVNVPSTNGTNVIEEMDAATDLTGVKCRIFAVGR